MSTHGEMTARIASAISDDWEMSGYRVLYDHGDPGNDNVGQIVSWSGEKYSAGSQLSQLDIAIVERKSNKVFVLIEIEESNDRPKTLIGDVFGVLMGDHICFRGKYKLVVDECTTLLVLGRSLTCHEKRNQDMLKKIMDVKPHLAAANARIGEVVIETFSDEAGLGARLPVLMDKAYSGYFQGSKDGSNQNNCL